MVLRARMKIEVFCEETADDLQKAVNDWLKVNRIKLISSMQSESEGYMTISLIYTEL